MQITSLSSVGSATLMLNPVAKATSVQVVVNAASTGTVGLWASVLDQTQYSSASQYWTLISSAATITTSVLLSSAGNGLMYSILSPIGAVRIVSTGNNGTIYLAALQSPTA